MHVIAFISKGEKFILDTTPITINDILCSLPQLGRQLHLHKFFGNEQPPGKRRCLAPSTWQPPQDAHVQTYLRLLAKRLHSYQPKRHVRNYSFNDLQALRWLKDNAHLVSVCDADKNLGSTLLPATKVRELSLGHLESACIKVQSSVALADTWNSQSMVSDIVLHHQRSGAITMRQQRFILSRVGLPSIGSFRIRPKIHKPVLEARPIFNFNQSWLQPIARFLSEALEPIAKSCQFTLENTDDLQSALCSLHIDIDDPIIAALDVDNLYPCLVFHLIITKVTLKVRAFYSDRPGFATLIINLTSTILRSQLVAFDGCIWKALVGIGTGLACGSQLANITLDDLDHDLAPLTLFLGRYIDDIICIISRQNLHRLISAANSWHHCINIKLADSGTSNVPFLDLAISIKHGHILFDLYRKPLSIYQYLPRGSCHRSQVFRSLVFGEALRIWRRCSFSADAIRHLQFFKSRLILRGYSCEEIDKFFALAKAKHLLANTFNPEAATRVKRLAFLKVRHSSSVKYHFLAGALAEHKHLLNSDIVCSSTSQKNIFRLLYRHTWRPNTKLVVGG